jgi:uncharacterized protein YktB (UPF0637 family)
VEFPGFQQQDFDLFSIPDFAGRMAVIREGLRPRLLALGADLAPRVEALTGLPAAAHTAQHMRRRVNPPPETWVAFARDRKGYKRWTHYRLAIGAEGVRAVVFVEDDAEDKPSFAAALSRRAASLRRALPAATPILWYTLDDNPVPNSRVSAARLRALGQTLATRKTAKFQAGIPLGASEVLRLEPSEFEAWVLHQFELLLPLYLAGCGRRSAVSREHAAG